MESCAYFYAMRMPFEKELPREVASVRDAAVLTMRRWRLCALNAEGALRLGEQPLRCDTLLLPEGVCPAGVRAKQVISYGFGGRNTLTLSSMDSRPMLSVQRAFQNLRGEIVEVQEIALPEDWMRFEKMQLLALAGICLLCGEW